MVLHTDERKILLQERGAKSRFGEEWSFWGGGVEGRESFEEAAVREVKEELEFDLKEFSFVGDVKRVREREENGEIIKENVHIGIVSSKVPHDFSLFTVNEGAGIRAFSIEEIRSLRMVPEAYLVLDQFEESQK